MVHRTLNSSNPSNFAEDSSCDYTEKASFVMDDCRFSYHIHCEDFRSGASDDWYRHVIRWCCKCSMTVITMRCLSIGMIKRMVTMMVMTCFHYRLLIARARHHDALSSPQDDCIVVIIQHTHPPSSLSSWSLSSWWRTSFQIVKRSFFTLRVTSSKLDFWVQISGRSLTSMPTRIWTATSGLRNVGLCILERVKIALLWGAFLDLLWPYYNLPCSAGVRFQLTVVAWASTDLCNRLVLLCRRAFDWSTLWSTQRSSLWSTEVIVQGYVPFVDI